MSNDPNHVFTIEDVVYNLKVFEPELDMEFKTIQCKHANARLVDVELALAVVSMKDGELMGYKQWVEDTTDMRKTYFIEVKVDFQQDAVTKYKLIESTLREAAANILATAALLNDGRPTQVAFRSDDIFEGNADLEIVNASDC